MRADEAKIMAGLLATSRVGASDRLVAAGRASLAAVTPAGRAVYRMVTAPGGLNVAPDSVARAQGMLIRRLVELSAVLGQINQEEAARAVTARTQAEIGSAVAMLLLLAVFAYFYLRSERLGRENEALLDVSREEASTDVLTGLGNRRALMDELSATDPEQEPDAEDLLLAIFDLNGFKQYNDTFGHAAGDALLARLGGRLSAAAVGSGSAYRMGGDEFCLLARCAPSSAEAVLDDARTALTDSGEGWHINCSYGAVWMPGEAATSSEALQIADERMYANKAGRSSAGRQIADVLLQVLNERDVSLDVHGDHVAKLSSEVAKVLHQPDHELERIRLAATLHDIGKAMIPESVLNKPGPLNKQDWEFVRRHTLIGERIVLAAPALASTAPLIRSSHERPDGAGYPDGLRGEEIPLGSRIIAACDALDVMTSERPCQDTRSVEAALQELRRCAGTQFDRDVVDALHEVVLSKQFELTAVA